MRQALLAIVLAFTFTSCGGGGSAGTATPNALSRAEQPCGNSEFINETGLTNAELMEQWMKAQKNIAGESPEFPNGAMLNELLVALNGAAPSHVIDSRALTIWPKCQRCVTLADVAGSSGFACSESPTGRCYGLIKDGVVYGAKSVEHQIYTYEFTTIILIQLGYKPQR